MATTMNTAVVGQFVFNKTATPASAPAVQAAPAAPAAPAVQPATQPVSG